MISTHNIATGDGLYRATAWAVLVRMSRDSVVVAVAIGMVSVLESIAYDYILCIYRELVITSTGGEFL